MFSQKKILVVEDNPINRDLLCRILASDYDVVEAANGQEALDVLGRYGEGISLILLDIVMPVMDGDTFLSIMKANPAYSSIPVIVTTQNDGESDEIAALSHGAADFVAKPYRPQIILHRVAGIINLRETAAMINLIQYDRLTGLYSREFFYQQVKGFLLRNPARHYDLVCSDIENFKLINDVFGIPAGNRLLCGVADMFRREVDGRGICGRIHADQFACLLDRQNRYTDEMFLQANARVSGLPEVRGIVMKWGIYTIEDRTVSVENMCDRALLAARSIKGQYGKHFARYDDTLRNQLLKEQAIADSMESALEGNQFVVYLQPKYRIKDESLIGAEALVRWDHPEWGLQSPAEFIPLFEKNGFITKLDQYVWDKACGILRDWDERGIPPFSISVNVSRADIYNADLAELLLNIVQSYGLAPSRLHLEITESAYTENPRQIIDTVTHLRELGFVIEMDDFGSGHSSLNMLNEMPIDILKLDMKFIQSEILKPNTQGILQFVINLARWMRLSVVAEGVETRDQLRRLGEIGCDYVQGYYFGRPMPRADFEPLLSGYGDPAADRRNDAIPLIQELPVLLVADEDEKYRAELRDAFARSYRIAEAGSGQEALAFLEAHRETAAVVLSLTLPDPDGLTVLQTLREIKNQWDIPILATAAPDAELENESLLLGADDFVCKPHFMQSLLRRLRRVVAAAVCRKKVRLLETALYQDASTGLLNQGGLSDALQALDQNDYPIVAYLFGLDSPPAPGAVPGSSQGDSRTAELSMLLRAQVRETDLLAHIGEGEFLLLCKRTTRGEDVEKRGSAICRAVCDAASRRGISVFCSAGAAILQSGDSMPDWMEHIRRALRQARGQGPGSCRVWNAEQV